MMAVTPIAMGIIAPFSGSLSDRVGSRPVAVVGLVVLLFRPLGILGDMQRDKLMRKIHGR